MHVPAPHRRFGVVAFRLLGVVAGCSGCADVHTGLDAARPHDPPVPAGGHELLLARRDGDEVVVWAGRMDEAFGDATTTELARVPMHGDPQDIGLWAGVSRDFVIVTLSLDDAFAVRPYSLARLVDLTTGSQLDIFAAVNAVYPEAQCGVGGLAWTDWAADRGSVIVECEVRDPEEHRVYRVDPNGTVERLGDDCTSFGPIDEAGRVLLTRSETCDPSRPRTYERIDPFTGEGEAWLGLSANYPQYWDPIDETMIDLHSVDYVVDSVWRVTADGSRELLRDNLPAYPVFLAMSDRGELPISAPVLDGRIPSVLRIAVHDLHSSLVRELPIPEELCISEGLGGEMASWSGSRLLVQCAPAAWIFEEDGDRVDLPQLTGETTRFSFSPDGAALLRDIRESDGRRRFDRVDPDTGSVFPLPAVFDALSPQAVTWRTRRWQQCGWARC